MTFVVVPYTLADEINRRLDKAYVEVPEAAVDRALHYNQLLAYYDRNGELPVDFSLQKKEP